MASKIFRHEFVVEGAGQFPFDMLRYDACFPKAHADVVGLERDSVKRDIVMIHVCDSRYWEPTYERWNSFGWFVKENPNTRRRKSA